MADTSLAVRILRWYTKNGRSLPWRAHPDPYAVWVSEIMLQQTRVETVIPYFEKWMKLFPDVTSLAKASEREVLNAWEGLGYYSRARNLHAAARIVARKFSGKLPQDLTDLRSLPGIGRYTVGAIASMAFGLDQPTLDGNLRRVFSRLFDLGEPADSSSGERKLWAFAALNMPKGRAADYNQALMDLGATICLPKNPGCQLCPLNGICRARKNGTQNVRPILKPRKIIPHYILAAGVIIQRGRVLLAQRPPHGLLGGMWEFPNGRVLRDPAGELANVLQAVYGIKVREKNSLGVVRHAYTHFKVTVHAFRCETVSIPRGRSLKWARLSELEGYPMGKVDRRIARSLGETI